ncbi:MAG: MFS transporter [Candidatus Sumerlaeia bacterium]
MSESIAPSPSLAHHHEERQRLFWRNYPALAAEGGIYMGGLAFIHMNAVLPRMIESLGGPQWIIAFTPIVMFMGVTSVQVFVARYIESLSRMKPLVMLTGVFQRLPYLLAGLFLFYKADQYPAVAVAVLVLAPLMSGLAAGLSMSAWQELVAKTIPENRLSSLWALRFVIAALIGLVAGRVIELVLANHPGSHGFGILHLIAFSFLLMSYVIFGFTRETNLPPKRSKDERGNWREFIRDIPATLKADKRLTLYLCGRFFWMGIHIVVPFLSIFAIHELQLPDTYLGRFLIAQTIGILAGNAIGAFVGDRLGGKTVSIICQSAFLLLCILSYGVSTIFGFYALFFLLGFSMIGGKIGTQTLGFEISPLKKRVAYLSMQNFFLFPGMLLASTSSSIIRQFTLDFYVLTIPSMVMVVISILFLLQVQEPRKGSL